MSVLASGTLREYSCRVQPEWIDYNGHMMDAYYFVAFTEATEAFLDQLGLGAAYRAESGCGIYTVESHLCFASSVREGATISYQSLLLGCDPKRLHVFHQMTASKSAGPVATNELMFLHVDLAAERVAPMPPERYRAASVLAATHAGHPLPANVGRGIHMPSG
ncbi:MAG TPA: thioesterase family protein [Streptosporangiaceae bacterium]